MARKGAAIVGDDRSTATGAWREAVRQAGGEHEEWQPDEWVVADDDEAVAASAGPPTRRGRAPAAGPVARDTVDRPAKLPAEVGAELEEAAGARRAAKLQQRLGLATRAYDHDRYDEALRYLRPLVKEAPTAPAVRELLGLTLYRMGRYAAAVKELDAYRELSRSYDQHPVLADCHRALKRWRQVDEVWEDLREASPSAELVAEGRIVAAGARSDQGDLAGAIALLEKAAGTRGRVRDHHLRTWYALADLYERAGELPRARELFKRVLEHDAEFFDAGQRVRALGR